VSSAAGMAFTRVALIPLLAVGLPLAGQSNRSYVGSTACVKCHSPIHHQWAESLHSKMLLPATEESIKGDFAQGRVALRGSDYLLQHRNGKYYITESYLSGKPWEHQVDYTLGIRRIQEYLTKLPDGRIIVLPSTWDVVNKKWIHDLDTGNPEEGGADVQLWNKSCYGCHVTNEKKGFEVEHLSYHTSWSDFGIGCESCHGPGSEHVAVAKALPVLTYHSVGKAVAGERLLVVPKVPELPHFLAAAGQSRDRRSERQDERSPLSLRYASLRASLRHSGVINLGALPGTTKGRAPSLVSPGYETGKTRTSKPLSASARAKLAASIVNPARLDSARSTMVCAACHSYRDIYADDFKAGDNYYDFFLPVMEYRLPASEDPAYWPDGHPRWLANEAIALWQSQCFLKGGATCVTCHSDPHNIDVGRDAKLRPDSNAICAQCHKEIAANLSAHTHHKGASPGSSCIECHMPEIVASLNTHLRDHSMSVPVPENTVRHNIPNACNLCHQEKNAQWATQQMNEWYGDKSREKLIRRADAFAAAHNGSAETVPALLQILSDSSEGPWIRANAAGYLGFFPNDPSAYNAVFRSFSDPEPLVRATAAIAIRPRAAQRAAVAPALALLLRDPVAAVQTTAGIALVGMGVAHLDGEDGEWFEHAKKLYRERAQLDADDPQQQFAAGRFSLLADNPDAAISFFRAAMKIDDTIPAQYYLARALVQKEDSQAALPILKTIPPNDPQYSQAQQLLAQLEANANSGGTATSNAGPADAQFRDGQQLYQNGNYGGAIKSLNEALRLAPNATWALTAQIYRAICLEKLARTQEAEAVMRSLSETPAGHQELDLQLAFIELLYDTGRSEEGLKRVNELIAAVPQSPMAHFWRAKLLFQLHRDDEAAKAAEESIRLLPDAPEAHNLLMRIYQKEGRRAEAALQAEWLRDYERRMQSR
jgi:tetratricopeptide (TPR) repeat protein